MSGARVETARLLYCNCTYSKVIEADVKRDVLAGLCESGADFDAVADLCEMAAKQDPLLGRIAAGAPAKIIACYPRAVRGLFHAAHAPLPDTVEVLNMRTESAEQIAGRIADRVIVGDETP